MTKILETLIDEGLDQAKRHGHYMVCKNRNNKQGFYMAQCRDCLDYLIVQIDEEGEDNSIRGTAVSNDCEER